ncbi:MAG: DNA gyrase inhibitor YacG [Methylophilaceae bacterium]
MQEEKTPQNTKQVMCPNCKKMAEFSPNNRYRPFCSERCKMIDLGDWANENYRIPDKHPPKNVDDTN